MGSKCGECLYEYLEYDRAPCNQCFYSNPLHDYPNMFEPKTQPSQQAKADAGKLQLTLVPTEVIRAIAKVRMYGVSKYPETGVDGWKTIEPERIWNAAYRHFIACVDDPASIDEESGLKHLYHCVTNLAFLCEMEGDNNDL